jgi:hypothetical protein
MSDNLRRRQPEDPQKINMGQQWEVEYWTKTLGVSEQVLDMAVENAGTLVPDIRAWLRRKGYIA